MNSILSIIGIIFVHAVLIFVIYKMIVYYGKGEPELNGSTKHKLRKMSKKYGLHIYKSENRQFPYYVREWDECFTEQEIIIHSKHYSYNIGMSLDSGLEVWDTHDIAYPYYVKEWDEYFECVADFYAAVKDWRMTQSLEDGFKA